MTKQKLHTRLSKYGHVYNIAKDISYISTYRRDNNKQDTSSASAKLIAYLDVDLDKLQDFNTEFGQRSELYENGASNFQNTTRDLLFHKCIYVKVTIEVPTKISPRKTPRKRVQFKSVPEGFSKFGTVRNRCHNGDILVYAKDAKNPLVQTIITFRKNSTISIEPHKLTFCLFSPIKA